MEANKFNVGLRTVSSLSVSEELDLAIFRAELNGNMILLWFHCEMSGSIASHACWSSFSCISRSRNRRK